MDELIKPIVIKYKHNSTSYITEFITDLALHVQYVVPEISWDDFAIAILKCDWSNYIINTEKSTCYKSISLQLLLNNRAIEDQLFITFVNQLPPHLACSKQFGIFNLPICNLFNMLLNLIKINDNYADLNYNWSLRFINEVIKVRQSILDPFDSDYEMYSHKFYSLSDVRDLAIIQSVKSYRFYLNDVTHIMCLKWSPLNRKRNDEYYKQVLQEVHNDIGVKWSIFKHKYKR